MKVNCKIAELMLGVKLARRCCQDLAAEAGELLRKQDISFVNDSLSFIPSTSTLFKKALSKGSVQCTKHKEARPEGPLYR